VSLLGRGAVVTGGGRGIGAATARALVRAGAEVVVASRTTREVEAVAAELRAEGARVWAVACDVSDEAQVRALAAQSLERLGHVDVLVNNAGVASSARLDRIPLEEWNRVMATNATGTFLCTRELAPAMAERGWGRIVNVASRAGIEGARYVAHYTAAKHAVVGFTRAAAAELSETGVTVNALCPGYVDTPMTAQTLANIQNRTGLSRESALESVLATTGQPCLIEAAEVADQALALCAEDKAGVTGQAIVFGEGGRLDVVNPATLPAPKGFSHGILGPRDGRLLFVAGQAGWDPAVGGEPDVFAAQFGRALDRVIEVIRAGGGGAGDVARLTVYVTDLAAYRGSRPALADVWRARFGSYYPAMALVEVKGLVDAGAQVEIEATAVIGGSR
jgi:NAD(P)-dependent dehydrogenase (short-subunit alcohol dehydrogenase family)/enamine deaminase RidA (YjgF/YER057c/UK114 family)